MIFVSVGHQMPFDRMLRLVDQWAKAETRSNVFAQTGESSFQPGSFPSRAWLSPEDYREKIENCDAVVAHAGTGTIIQALQLSKPLLVLPRLSRHGETRNDHQVGTARYFESRGLLMAAYDDVGFLAALDDLEEFKPPGQMGDVASKELLARVSSFLTSPDSS